MAGLSVWWSLIWCWRGRWLRQFARLLTAGTVAANVSAGWPDPIAVGLHSAAPVMLLVMVEAARVVLLRRIGYAAGTARDRIPLGRWLLSPWRTWLLWRRMVLWQVTSYRQALDEELNLRMAYARLQIRYGSRWKRKAPADLVWMLRTGVCSAEACARLRSLMDGEDGDKAAVSGKAGNQTAQPVDGTAKSGLDGEQLAEAMRLNEHHWAQAGRPVSAETVRKHLRIGAATARALTRAVREANRAAVDGSSAAAIGKNQPSAVANGFRLHHVSSTALLS
ncbi:DUF2637 domain-containing protein [Kibdelosporangium philippinense]|uniref:DUF2637 domain-containing protein n=2 Tax=Kibdelosporangium philippinense TaxID=211113 RepID=A0ABS8ZH69_9PSEU|nr:DUF2637 domain-containing protein [Kibdelosporangium philippinense]MCE7006902.1 DUF2637 domain-containing protein [Kibdelosporangium philippinense]